MAQPLEPWTRLKNETKPEAERPIEGICTPKAKLRFGTLGLASLQVQALAPDDALLSSLLDPLEGLSMLNCGKLELGAAPNFQH
jgi:hypothetical protein